MNRRIHSTTISLVALCLAAAGTPAIGQGVDGQAAFSASVPPAIPGVIPQPGGVFEFDPAQGNEVTIQLLCGGFGGTHLGLLAWVGDITLNDPAGGSTLLNSPAPLGLRAPYNFGNIQGVNTGTSITGIDANRSAFQNDIIWLFGDPQPQPALYNGIDAWDDVYRVTISLIDSTPRDIVISAAGLATFVTAWSVTQMNPPIDGGFPGFVSYAVSGITTDQADGAVVLRIVPAPNTLMLLSVGVLAASRRVRANW